MSKVKNYPGSHLPVAPWVYINDPTEGSLYAKQLVTLLPKVDHIQLNRSLTTASSILALITAKGCRDRVIMVTGTPFNSDASAHCQDAQLLQQAAIKHGCNFASVNLLDRTVYADGQQDIKSWGTNHLTQAVDMIPDATTVHNAAEKIYKWFFDVLTVLETLHIIPDSQLSANHSLKGMEGSEYCPVFEAYQRPRDASIHFVALILTKPVVGPNKRISWQVADKSGMVTFYLEYRGPHCQRTWDWVLGLQPGDRKCLPRMRSVLVKEKTLLTVAKVPFRLTGMALLGTGSIIRKVGMGLGKIGDKVKWGSHSEWVLEHDATTDKNGRAVKKSSDNDGYVKHETVLPKTTVIVFNAQGEKTWKDDDSIASTAGGSLCPAMRKHLDDAWPL